MPTPAAIAHERQTYAQYAGVSESLVITGQQALSSALVQGGRYLAFARGCPVYFRQGGAGVVVDDAQEYLPVGVPRLFNVLDGGTNRIAAVTASNLGGELRITRIDSLPGVAAGDPIAQRALYFREVGGSTLKLTSGGAAVRTAQLAAGSRHRIVCFDDDLYIRQGSSSVVATSADMVLSAGTGFWFNVDTDVGGAYLSILSTGANPGAFARVTRLDAVT